LFWIQSEQTMKATAKKVKRSVRTPRAASRVVRFEYVNPLAKAVYLAGTFNDWHPSVTEMIKVGDNCWAKELALAPGAYEYRLVVDGRWMPDPSCSDSRPNPYGEQNSVLIVGSVESAETRA
jgi:1,4-alpha-glucan branching enzyme